MSSLKRLFVLGLIVILGLQPAWMVAHAQTGEQPVIQYNTPLIVTLPPGQTVIRTFMVAQDDNFDIRLTRLADYPYTALLLDPAQQTTPLPLDSGGNSFFSVAEAPQSGEYSLVFQASETGGDLLILVSSTTVVPVPLALGETVVSLETTGARFLLESPGLSGNMRLSIDLMPGSQPGTLSAFTLIEPGTGDEVLAVREGIMSGLTLVLPAQTPLVLAFQPGTAPFQLQLNWSPVSSTSQIPTPTPVGELPTPTLNPALPTLTPPPTVVGVCQVAFAGPVNIRTGPSTAHPVIGAGNPGTTLIVTGRNSDSSWWQVDLNTQAGWVSNQIQQVITQGDCSAIALASFPPPPTPTPTSTPTPTFTPPPTFTPTLTPSPTATYTPVAAATLNYSLPPNYGSTALSSGFVPDPYTTGMTSGGPVDVSYLGGGCSGFVTSAPDFSVNYTAGAFPVLRFYFIGNGDSTMVVNTPGGSYVCVDDSFGTLNPTIDFNSPSSGRYDIWIGSYAVNTTVAGTFYVTENTGNHP
ncbi:MAG: SH3 domain-containing protein [Anaerolineae bacterium]|nr:SH3 domain-containing protein [Anaerolineae bacterium]